MYILKKVKRAAPKGGLRKPIDSDIIMIFMHPRDSALVLFRN